jgi:hypothetical protein
LPPGQVRVRIARQQRMQVLLGGVIQSPLVTRVWSLGQASDSLL